LGIFGVSVRRHSTSGSLQGSRGNPKTTPRLRLQLKLCCPKPLVPVSTKGARPFVNTDTISIRKFTVEAEAEWISSLGVSVLRGPIGRRTEASARHDRHM
jgi:hypothetical protein